MRVKIQIAVALAFALAASAWPEAGRAAGPSTHLLMTRKALDQVGDPRLAELLEQRLEALMCGVCFPDFGTAVEFGTLRSRRPEFGELAHRPEFVEAYYDHVAAKCAPAYEACEGLVAHLLGVAAHDLEDDLYDYLFLNKAAALDPGGDRVIHDLWADELLVVKYDPFAKVPRYWLPTEDLIEIYRGLGMRVTAKELAEGKRFHRLGASGLRALALIPYPYYSLRMSFTKANIMTHPGGVDHTAEVIARYFKILWDRLQGAPRSPDFILETWPQPAAADHEWDHASLYSHVTVYFTTGVKLSTVTEATFYLVGPDGKRVKARFNKPAEVDNVVALVPEEDLEPGTKYTAVIGAAVTDLRGERPAQDLSWSFITKY